MGARVMRAFILPALLFLAACGGGSSPSVPTTPTLDASKWDFRYGENFSGHPSPAPGGFSFVFPTQGGEIDYLTTDVNMKATVHARITLKVEAVSGAPEFRAHNDNPQACDRPAYVRIMLEKKNDSALTDEFGRWWASVAYELKPGATTMDVPLTDLTLWSSVFGRYASDRSNEFHLVLANLGKVGVTFGGCGSYGHGAWTVGGTAKMTVTEFVVQ